MISKTITKLFLLVCILLIAGCDTNLFEGNEAVKIRIENNSEFEMENITVSFPKEEVSYGTLRPGENSDFFEVKKAYRYAYLETEIDGEQAVVQPIDYVGEQLLDAGKYTYQLYVTAQNESDSGSSPRYYLGIELKKN
ncbi:MAG: hypothetical protein CL670_06845 [Balneola sp.]|jgi:hypothetical protein|nr:hypothetical protein [Balneola sp.]MBE78851.1 hypothetical protein [Balneola sp.]HBX64711.1 hypothetical protein [Balneolaceae bacterium]|tara:strand:- start:673 stop:1086 length:414 start_codon:yes stop_codon:yes gene_type:complete